MSVRAYKIEKVSSEPSFNCWHDEQIMDIACLDNYSDGGIIYIEKERAINLKNELEQQKPLTEEAVATIDALYQIIRDCGDDDGCDYMCY